ncbi:MAG: nucleotidyltransferase domain-containing protein, partial [Candidatus Aenigmarchaeota archaeon]|nr:nucleotidyltransferase domain-containing protein [Candidatus Aenigmarchaeota archaeon]
MGKANAKVIEMAKDFKEKTRKKYGIRKMILFGSQSRGDAGMDSDIDFIIVADRIKKKH